MSKVKQFLHDLYHSHGGTQLALVFVTLAVSAICIALGEYLLGLLSSN